MPKTKFQSFIFTLMMVFVMVYVMTVYAISLKMGGLSYVCFGLAIKEMWIEFVIVFVLIYFIVTRLAMKLARRIIDPVKNPPVFMTLAIQCFTVCLIEPAITLIATFLHNGFTADWLIQWLTQAVLCFPMAFFFQIFFAGPFVRLIFRTIFKKQLA
ncbi:MAG: DUF2798 domain-containing protein [Parasporobacterium sp.]|nr:DUF2798 domain-containing protein [Parasporobacterium sp.]